MLIAFYMCSVLALVIEIIRLRIPSQIPQIIDHNIAVVVASNILGRRRTKERMQDYVVESPIEFPSSYTKDDPLVSVLADETADFVPSIGHDDRRTTTLPATKQPSVA